MPVHNQILNVLNRYGPCSEHVICGILQWNDHERVSSQLMLMQKLELVDVVVDGSECSYKAI